VLNIDPSAHFPGDYQSARRAFLAAAERRATRVASHPIRRRGPRGEELAIDTAYIGPQAPETLIVVTSGTHGVEGFAGSAIQHRFLAEQLDGFAPPAAMGILVIHAVNPFGFAHLRRVNENNVDLNRNFLRHPDEHVPNPDYETLFEAINPDDLEEESERARQARLLEFAREHGTRRLQEVLTCGQYTYRMGLQFGGVEEEESNRLIRLVLRNETRGARRVAWIDIHTGLGPYGVCEMISQAAPEAPAYRRGARWYGDAVRSTVAGDSVTPYLNGDILDGALTEISSAVEVTPFAPEFGTYDLARIFLAMRADNWLHHHGDLESPQARAIKAELLEVFRPANADWQSRILDRGARILEQTRDGLIGDRER
jgi:hypothetical protein